MKKSTLKSLVAYLNGETITNLDEIRDELATELTKYEAKAEANRTLYDEATTVLLTVLDKHERTAQELFAATDTWPEDFTRGKLQYLLRNLTDKVVAHDNGHAAKTYTRA